MQSYRTCIPEPLLCSPAPAAPTSPYARQKPAPWEDPYSLTIVRPPFFSSPHAPYAHARLTADKGSAFVAKTKGNRQSAMAKLQVPPLSRGSHTP